MKLLRRFCIVLLTLCITLALALMAQASSDDVPVNLSISPFNQMPLSFTENQGQWDKRVQFRANACGAAMWFTTDGVYYQFTRRIPAGQDPHDPDDPRRRQMSTQVLSPEEPAPSDSMQQLVIRTEFVGANPSPTIFGNDLMEYKCNYFIGDDPDEWHRNVPNYKAVVFADIYAGIDLKYFGNGKQMEYDFIVSPGADPNQIIVQYDGAKSISVNDAGELVVETDWGDVTELRPFVYQLDAHGCIPIKGRYVLFTDNTFGFDLGDRYDPALALVIDPVLSYSTYVGGSDMEMGEGIAVDGDGCAYITGLTSSTNFPTENPYQGTFQGGDWDVFVTKLSASGNSLVYSTYLGGGDRDENRAIAVDDNGCVYVAGTTRSTDFPTQNPYQTDQTDWDAFVTKLSASGSSLVYSTYLGGSGADYGEGIAVDEVYCA